VAEIMGAGKGEAALESNDTGLPYFSRSFLENGVEIERICSMDEAR
jgi:hypothetical protein